MKELGTGISVLCGSLENSWEALVRQYFFFETGSCCLSQAGLEQIM
jgi:hypothetical protein